jgi:NAD(P)-dependent dehydrogenase (short-subunit alcohol dehydrogenase family)
LSSLKSIQEFAGKIIKEEEQVDILVNNAAVMRCPHRALKIISYTSVTFYSLGYL